MTVLLLRGDFRRPGVLDTSLSFPFCVLHLSCALSQFLSPYVCLSVSLSLSLYLQLSFINDVFFA